MNETRRYTVSGLVQGVWYRRHVSDAAIRIGLTGWVRNTHDGKVEVLAKGSSEQLGQLLAELWEGSPMSKVESIDSQQADDSDVPAQGFEIRW